LSLIDYGRKSSSFHENVFFLNTGSYRCGKDIALLTCSLDFALQEVMEIAKFFGGTEELKEAVNQLQTLLYAA
jgi:hypothetical protein